MVSVYLQWLVKSAPRRRSPFSLIAWPPKNPGTRLTLEFIYNILTNISQPSIIIFPYIMSILMLSGKGYPMQAIPPALQARFEDHLRSRAIPAPLIGFYRKWLRYYLDYCDKYHFSSRDQNSLPRFIGKLRDKKQTEQQQRQAAELFKANGVSHSVHFLGYARWRASEITGRQDGGDWRINLLS